MNYELMTAPCGLDCFNCNAYSANTNDKLRKVISKKLGIPFEKATCQGCRNENGNCAIIPMNCNVYPCAKERGVNFCCDCQDFPCDYLHPYADKAAELPHNTKVFNLCLIKKMGINVWAKEKAKDVRNTYYTSEWKL